MSRAAEDDERAARYAMAAAAEAVFRTGSAKRKRAEEGLQQQKRETEQVHAAARAALEAAVKVKEDAETDTAGVRQVAAAERAALDVEKAAMEKTYACQTSIIQLAVGRRSQSLTSELNLRTFGTHRSVRAQLEYLRDTSTGSFGSYGGQDKLQQIGKRQSKLKLSGNGNECKPLPREQGSQVRVGCRR